MAKWYGIVGYAESVKLAPGVWDSKFTERQYYGDVIRNMRRLENGEHLNDDINVNNLISIVADEYAYQNFQGIRYVEFMNSLWKVTSVEVQHPRLILTIGGVYNKREDE